MNLKIWRLNPKGIRLEKAEKTLHGNANEAGVKFCRPYSSCNALGWWVFSPVDLDIIWRGGKIFEHKLLEPWPNVEHDLVNSLTNEKDNVKVDDFCPASGRSHLTIGAVDDGIVQIWTGCIFKTPPGWCLQIRSPINCNPQPYYVMEGILETDWMQYDIWINLVFTEKDKLIQIRKNQWPPLAQLIPTRRESVDGDWQIGSDKNVNREEAEDNEVFEYWMQYNHKKYSCGGRQKLNEVKNKNATTFWLERQKNLDKETLEPKPKETKPIVKTKVSIPKKFKRKK